MKIRAILAILLLAWGTGCRKIPTGEPEYLPASKKYQPELSLVSIPVEIPLKLIEDRINRQFSGLVYNDESYTRPSSDNLMVRVYMNKRIGVTGNGNEMLFSIPLNIWAKGRWTACSVCPEIERQTAFDVDVFLKTRVELQKNYQLRTLTRSDGFEWKSPPKISLGPINVNIARLLEKTIDEQLAGITKEIDRNVNAAMDLSAHVGQLWSMAYTPVLLDDETSTWLQLSPVSILAAPATADNTSLNLNLGMELILETFTGKRPEARHPQPLPLLKSMLADHTGLVVHLRSELGFKEATAIAASRLKGETFAWKNRTVSIEGVEIYGKGDYAYIRLLVAGSVKGELFLYGIPRFDTVRQELWFDKLDYDIKTRSALLKTANWLASGMVQNKLREKLRFSFSEEVNSVRAALEMRISNFRYKNVFTLRGQVNTFDVQDIFVAGSHFDVVLLIEGKANIRIDGIDF